MKIRKGKVLSIILVFALLLVILPQNMVFAEEDNDVTFDDAREMHDKNMSNFWNAIEVFYGPDEETPGVIGRYWEARDTFADNVEELYEEAVTARATCVTVYDNVKVSYALVLEKYNELEDIVKEESEMIEWKSGLEEGFTDATNVINDLEEVPAIVDDIETIYINEEGNLHGNPQAPNYWKVNEDGLLTVATENDYTLKIEKGEGNVKIRMRNFVFSCTPDYDADAFWSESPVVLTLEGTNRIVAERGNAFGVIGDLVVEGTGSLELKATAEKIIPENGEEPYETMALYVGGGFKNSASITCDSKNSNHTVFFECESKDIVNKGTFVVGENQKIATVDYIFDEFITPKNYSSITEYPVPTDHVYIGKVYYYTPDMIYPNTICGQKGNTDQWTVYGNYDEAGNPIGSNVWYQYWYVDERGGILTEDLVNPVQFLVYEEQPEALIEDKDIVSVSDGKTHVFDADLYALWFTDGDVTVNGNIIQDFACFNVADRIPSESGEYFEYVFDREGNRVWIEESKANSKVIVNGDVGLLSLNDSFIGNVTVNGNVNLIGFYEDLHESVKTTLDRVPESFYGSKANAGDIIQNGEFVGISKEVIEGFKGYSVYNTEDFYTQTERTINGEEVHGTVAAIHDDALLIDVTKSVVGENTWPCVKEVDEERENAVKSVLTDTDSKLIVMDISLIQDNTEKIEPSTTLNLYFDDVTGFDEPAVYHIKADGEIEKLFVYDGTDSFGGDITCSTNSFSTYFIAENQELKSNSINSNENSPNTPSSDNPVTPPDSDAPTPPNQNGAQVSGNGPTPSDQSGAQVSGNGPTPSDQSGAQVLGNEQTPQPEQVSPKTNDGNQMDYVFGVAILSVMILFFETRKEKSK